MRKRKARRKAVGTRAPILVEARANARRSLDFVHDQFARGQRFRELNVVDNAPANFCRGVRLLRARPHRVLYAALEHIW